MIGMYGEGWLFGTDEDNAKLPMLLLRQCSIEIRLALDRDLDEKTEPKKLMRAQSGPSRYQEETPFDSSNMIASCFSIVEQCVRSLSDENADPSQPDSSFCSSYSQLSPQQLIELQTLLIELMKTLCSYLESLQMEKLAWPEDRIQTLIFQHPFPLAIIRLLGLWLSVDMESLVVIIGPIIPILIEFSDQVVEGLYPIEFLLPFFYQISEFDMSSVPIPDTMANDSRKPPALHDLFNSFLDNQGLRTIYHYLERRTKEGFLPRTSNSGRDDAFPAYYYSLSIILAVAKHDSSSLSGSEWKNLIFLLESLIPSDKEELEENTWFRSTLDKVVQLTREVP